MSDPNPKPKKPFWQTKPREVYVKGLPFVASHEDIKSFFKDCGEISKITQQQDVKGRWIGSCFLKFADKTSIPSALLMNESIWTGKGGDGKRFIHVVEKVPKKVSKNKKKTKESDKEIVLSNIPNDMTCDSIEEFLVPLCGPIKKIRLKMKIGGDGEPTGKCEDFAHVEFVTREACVAALRLKKEDLILGEKTTKIAIPTARDAKKKKIGNKVGNAEGVATKGDKKRKGRGGGGGDQGQSNEATYEKSTKSKKRVKREDSEVAS